MWILERAVVCNEDTSSLRAATSLIVLFLGDGTPYLSRATSHCAVTRGGLAVSLLLCEIPLLC